MKGENKKTSRSRASSLRGMVFVALSGGVDSSVAALLLKKQGYYVVGVFMRCWKDESGVPAGKSCMQKDAEDARKVAEKLEIPFYVWDFEKEYKKRVVDYMIDGYKKGITPNPDIMCNKEIKFGLFLEKALKMGADYVATGHYVRLRKIKNPAFGRVFKESRNEPLMPRLVLIKRIASRNKMSSIVSVDNFEGRGPAGNQTPEAQVPTLAPAQPGPTAYLLYQAKDKNKDQSYFLWTLTQEQLEYCLFPIGDYLKSEVRQIAKKAGLHTAEKKDSQGICFLGKVTLDEFLGKYIPEKKGDILLADTGKKIGKHKGAYFYTIGQRHINANFQFPISNFQKNRKPYYVAEKDIKTNTLIVAEGSDNQTLYKKEIELVNINFINPDFTSLIRVNRRIEVLARVRYRQPLAKAELIINPRRSASKNKNPCLRQAGALIRFYEKQKFIASGQSVVFYHSKGEMLGGGIIL